MEPICKKLLDRETELAIIGLGYVGMPLAKAFSERMNVIGYDIDDRKIKNYQNGKDPTNQIDDIIDVCNKIVLTTDKNRLRDSKVFIVAVPTPIHNDYTPDIRPIKTATCVVGEVLKQGDYVIYESTVYPGMTEEVCVPLLEGKSGLTCGKDFFVGYSPERVNPCDSIHSIENVVKVVSGLDEQTAIAVEQIYQTIIKGGTCRVSSVKIAEACKVLENTQRDINIAFMNEISMALEKMNIPTEEVYDAMSTKWNALNFRPGLVGGHCISVDPYYFISKAQACGYSARLISVAREINESVADFVVQKVIKALIKSGRSHPKTRIAILGVTFKENCPDIRNSKAIDIIQLLQGYNFEVVVTDPHADAGKVFSETGILLQDIRNITDVDCIIMTLAHDEYKKLRFSDLERMYEKGDVNMKIFMDVKSCNKYLKNKKEYIYLNL